MITKDHRIEIWKPPENFKFLDLVKDPVWIGAKPLIRTRKIQYKFNDEGKYHTETHRIIFGAYFFLSEQRLEHSRFVYNLIQLASTAGGLIAGIWASFGVMVMFINEQYLIAKFVRALFFDVS